MTYYWLKLLTSELNLNPNFNESMFLSCSPKCTWCKQKQICWENYTQILNFTCRMI